VSDSPGRRLLEAVRRANAPPPPEHSVALRVATAAAVFTGIAACERVGELSLIAAVLAIAGIGAGMVYSYLTRRRPWQRVKLVLAIAVLAVFVDFVLSISSAARVGDLASVEGPLAGLFVWVQVVHSVDVPARRDLLFSLAASAVLLAVAGAQAIDSSFAVFVVIWGVALVTGLTLSWRSVVGGGGSPPVGTVVASLAVITLGAGLVISVLPAPEAERGFTLPASLASFVSLTDPGGLTGGSTGAQPAQPGQPGGATGVGGYVGFAGPLDTAIRGALGNQIVFHVRATVPGYFLGTTYDHWDGQSWTSSPAFRGVAILSGGSPFQLPPGPIVPAGSVVNVQTFYVAVPLPNLIFATDQPQQVWFPGRKLYLGADGSIRTGVAITPGTVYTVVSQDDELTPAQLALDGGPDTPPPSIAQYYLQLPHPYPQVEALTESIVAGHASLESKVEALESWMSSHVRYSTDIPPLLPGQDAVNQFLFGSRVGFCEQISTALVVMLRTIGVGAREAIGYVPGSYNPLTNLYEVQASDAHAWVQVYFPGIGWQSFDPTADVPLAPPDPGAVLLGDAWHQIVGLPWQFLLPAGVACVTEESLRRRWRRRPRTWTARAARLLEVAGARLGVIRRPAETLSEYMERVSSAGALGPAELESLHYAVSRLERSAYGPDPGDPQAQAATVSAARRGAATLGRRRPQLGSKRRASSKLAPPTRSSR
jgi:transglutaminase-like putative cysteine protease